MGLQREVSASALLEVAQSLQDLKLSDAQARQKSHILQQKLNDLSQGNVFSTRPSAEKYGRTSELTASL